MTIKELLNIKRGVLLVYEVPKTLKPMLPSLELIDKFDSNYGIDKNWVKLVIHIQKDHSVGHFNLPRVLWVRKDWTLKQMH